LFPVRPIFLPFAVIVVLGHASLCAAETPLRLEATIPPAEEIQSFRITVRAIDASGGNHPTNPQGGTETPSTIQLDDGLEDLRSRLEQLPFSTFRLVTNRVEQLPLKKRRELTGLPDGETLCLRPVSAENGRIGIFMKWRERSGSEILNARVQVDADEAILTGTDHGSSEARILAIRVDSVTAEPGIGAATDPN
jgi:hypothetical protein